MVNSQQITIFSYFNQFLRVPLYSQPLPFHPAPLLDHLLNMKSSCERATVDLGPAPPPPPPLNLPNPARPTRPYLQVSFFSFEAVHILRIDIKYKFEVPSNTPSPLCNIVINFDDPLYMLYPTENAYLQHLSQKHPPPLISSIA